MSSAADLSRREAFRKRLSAPPPLVYALLDDSLLRPEEFEAEAEALIVAGVEALQLRSKSLPDSQLVELVDGVLTVTRAHGVPLIINDRVDVAVICGADGVHLGAEDLPPAAARRILSDTAILGSTAHSLEELEGIAPNLVDYVGYGAVFRTKTRIGAGICGPEALTAAVAASSLPIVAIGGISPANVQSLRESGIAAVAVASSVSPTRACPGAVSTLRQVLADW